jgi:hypothetical protein
MTAKQKAIQLFNKYNDFPLTDWWKKQCALIAVDEILNAITFNMYDEDAYNKEDKYWQDVKQEIEKL